ncbi:hypothetical protein FB567DRAFT_510731 [Paraphoma chrysanthemicola]|uniref:Uncharacterized protein n=1 Tax=Paraphoma chrysanthemicola TaxID=798071 RepID=A0A8K0REN8_9PLEO|nr:hypothetical protein FB567DRAFT_510731 [Paraphoma chrysanthemicola]
MTLFRRCWRRCRTETTLLCALFCFLPLLSPVNYGAGTLGRFALGTWEVVHGGITGMSWVSICEEWGFLLGLRRTRRCRRLAVRLSVVLGLDYGTGGTYVGLGP